MKEAMQTDENPIVFLDVAINGARAGRVVILLRHDIAPKTVENFRALCTGERGIGKTSKKPLHFKGIRFHKAITQFMVQGGDIVSNNGTNGESIYGKFFEDENFILPHDTGVVSMANAGRPNSNSSQFFITTVPCSHLNGINVAFGKVLKGLSLIIEMDKCLQNENNFLLEECVIIDCGVLEPGEDWNIGDNDIIGDILPAYPEDLEIPDIDGVDFRELIVRIKLSGNEHFANGSYAAAVRKYLKAMRYIQWMSSKSLEEFNYSNIQMKAMSSENKKLTLNCMCNLAAAKLKMNDFKDVTKLCNEILVYEPKNVKALFRRGQANMMLNNYTSGLNDLIFAKTLCPSDNLIKKELRKFLKINSKYRDYEKNVYKKLFV